MALTTTTPAAGFNTTPRPVWLPISATSAACTSRQKSASELVRTCELSSARAPPLFAGAGVGAEPDVTVPAAADCVIELEVTRMSEAPWRRPGR